ncbi:MAG: pantothenate kinase [Candidatus Methanomethylophilaceae archaeon]
MTTAYCPGHVTCFFYPVRSQDILSAGSRGAGIRLSRGSTVTLEERSDRRIEIQMDGRTSVCGITRSALRMVAPERGFDVTVTNELPVGQGFGMSAAGAVAASLCACHIAGRPRQEAFRAAHIAEIEGGGGLGDVAGIMCKGHQPTRVVAGLPPLGKVVDSGYRLDLNVAVLGETLDTGAILGDKEVMSKMMEIGPRFVDAYAEDSTERNLFSLSRSFSKMTGLETPEVSDALEALSEVGDAGMCMLGHSIFTTVPNDQVKRILGNESQIYRCPSTDREAEVIRKG